LQFLSRSRGPVGVRARYSHARGDAGPDVEVLVVIDSDEDPARKGGGSTSKKIAAKLYISAATVETHWTNLMTRLGVRNVAGLVSYAFRAGFVKLGPNASSSVRRT